MRAYDFNLSDSVITDSNCWHRRFFRCWIDGSYLGQEHYLRNCDYAREHFDDYRKLRSFCIGEFCNFMAHEYECSPSTVRKHMLQHFSTEQLETLNAELVDDLRDLVRYEFEG